jgi:hypothetical protein
MSEIVSKLLNNKETEKFATRNCLTVLQIIFKNMIKRKIHEKIIK